jgi:hypothetical protein
MKATTREMPRIPQMAYLAALRGGAICVATVAIKLLCVLGVFFF